MQFTDVFIRRPVFATVLSLIILLVGLRAYLDLPVRQYPNIEASVVTITTTYPGASAQLLEGFVTTPLEGALVGIDGVDFMESSNVQGSSTLTLHFRIGYDINKAVTDVSNAVASVRSVLPREIDSPVIAKDDPNARPTMYLAFASDNMPIVAVSDYLLRVVKPQLATLSGVGRVDIYASQYAMRIWLNPDQMTAHNLTADEIQNALNANNVQSAAGRLQSKWQELDVIASTDLRTAEQFNNMVLKQENGYLIRLRDVGKAILDTPSERSSAFIMGKRTAVMAVTPQANANPLDVATAVNKVLPNIQAHLPTGLQSSVIWDSSKFIAESIVGVRHTILEAAICVILVIFLFLGSMRAVLIPVVTIPLALIGVCSLMLVMNYSLNTLTLLAWVLAIGLVVDDSIVVLENIHRHIEAGMKPFDAALTGAREIGFAVIAMTLTLAAVYAPIGFMTGITGSLFREFAFTLAGAVVISGFVALTLSPMMCAYVLHHEVNRKGLPEKLDELFNKLMRRYQLLLAKVLTKRTLVVIIAAIIYASCYFLYSRIPAELAPQEDQGAIMTIAFGPTSANLAYTEKYTKQIEEAYKTVPEALGYILVNGYPKGVNSAISFLVLKPWEERKRAAGAIIQALFMPLMSIPGLQAFPLNLPALPGSGNGSPVEFIVKTTSSYHKLNTAMGQLLAAAAKNPELLNTDSDLKLDKLQASLEIDRNKASDMGITTGAISNTLNILLGEPTVTRFVMEGRSYPVIPQLLANFRDDPHELDKINLRTLSGNLVPIANIVKISETIGPQTLTHFQQLRSAVLSASLPPGYTLGQALAYLKTAAKALPADMQIDFRGQSRQLIEASGAMQQTFLFALIFIFLVLAAQFESFRTPLIVMVSVPLSLSGALLAMMLTKCTMNIYTQIGLVTLIGLITKHGILIVEFANQLQEKGEPLYQAVIDAAAMRLRPILMTTAAMVLGALPLALASGAGSEARRQIGWVIIGGMSFGTLLTLFVVPTAYTLLAKIKSSAGKPYRTEVQQLNLT